MGKEKMVEEKAKKSKTISPAILTYMAAFFLAAEFLGVSGSPFWVMLAFVTSVIVVINGFIYHRWGLPSTFFAFCILLISIATIEHTVNNQPGRIIAYDSSAGSAGRNAAFAQEVFHAENENTYSTKLNELLGVDKTLTDDDCVTYVFLYASKSSYLFRTTHAHGTGKVFTYSSETIKEK